MILYGKATLPFPRETLVADVPDIDWPADSTKTEYTAIQALKGIRGFQWLHEQLGKWSSIDDLGAADANRTQPVSVRYQYRGLWQARLALIYAGVDIGSPTPTDYIYRASTAWEWSFDILNPTGYFENGESVDPTIAIEGDTFFMGAYADTYLLVEDTPGLGALLTAYQLYEPRVDLSMGWLNTNVAYIVSATSQTPNRALFAAVAFYLNGLIRGNATWANQGISLYNIAMGMRHIDGYFLEKGGYDSSYQAVSMFNMAYLFFAATDAGVKATIKADLQIACDWMITRIASTGEISTVGNSRTGPDGEVGSDGKVKLVNYGEVALALYYCAFILNDITLAETANSVINYLATNT